MPRDLGISIHSRHERCPFEINLGCASTVAVIHRLRGPLHHSHAINGDICVLLIVILFIGGVLLSVWFLRIRSRIAVSRTLAWRCGRILIVLRGWRGALLGAEWQKCKNRES